jgi:phospholipid-translocating ATPase
LVEYKCQGEPVPNSIRNQKYSILTFVPLVLYKEFQYFFNLFYLLTAVSQFIPALKVGLMFSFLAPLCLVLFLTMVKEGYEDYQRYKKDKQINSSEFMYIIN